MTSLILKYSPYFYFNFFTPLWHKKIINYHLKWANYSDNDPEGKTWEPADIKEKEIPKLVYQYWYGSDYQLHWDGSDITSPTTTSASTKSSNRKRKRSYCDSSNSEDESKPTKQTQKLSTTLITTPPPTSAAVLKKYRILTKLSKNDTTQKIYLHFSDNSSESILKNQISFQSHVFFENPGLFSFHFKILKKTIDPDQKQSLVVFNGSKLSFEFQKVFEEELVGYSKELELKAWK